MFLAFCLNSPSAVGTEDVELPEDDDEKRENTVYVTGSRLDGSLSGLVLFIQNGGTIDDFIELGLYGDGLSFAIACSRNPDSDACNHLKCELDPYDPSCESVLSPIIVTAERPEIKTYEWLFNFIRTSYGTLLLDLGLVPPDSEKAKKLTEREVCELLKEAKEELLQKAFEDLDWIEDQYHETYGPRQPYYFLRYRLGYDLSTVRKVEFDPNDLAREILEHGKKLLIKGYAKDGTILAKVDYW